MTKRKESSCEKWEFGKRFKEILVISVYDLLFILVNIKKL